MFYKAGGDDYRIVMTVVGFSDEELTITQEQNMLFVAGQKTNRDEIQHLLSASPTVHSSIGSSSPLTSKFSV